MSPATNFPEVNQTYRFDNLTYPAQHSIQAGVLTGKRLSVYGPQS